MSTSHRVYSDLFQEANFVNQTAVSQGKNLLIDVIRESFKKDTFYRYTHDAFGFPLTPDLTALPPDIQEERTTRIYIGDVYRYDKRFNPSITVRHSSGKYKPISINQNHTTKYRLDLVIDGYGNRSYIRVPTHRVITGAWEQTFEVKITSESTQDREELTDIVTGYLQGVVRQELYEAGLFVRGVSMSSETEEDWANDKLYIQSISLETYSEWRRHLPINSVIETLNFCFNYGILGSGNFALDSIMVHTEDNTISYEVPVT